MKWLIDLAVTRPAAVARIVAVLIVLAIAAMASGELDGVELLEELLGQPLALWFR